MNPYTVILLYPDYLADSYGQDTYMTQLHADDPTEALAHARAEIAAASGDDTDPADFYCVAVISGFHNDLNPEL